VIVCLSVRLSKEKESFHVFKVRRDFSRAALAQNILVAFSVGDSGTPGKCISWHGEGVPYFVKDCQDRLFLMTKISRPLETS
jgi:hypothetical protein